MAVVRRMKLGSESESKVTEKTLLKIADDLKAGRMPADRFTISDDLVVGLRCLILKSGEATYSVSYHFEGERPYLKIGSARKDDPDYISLADAREITKTIKALADKRTESRMLSATRKRHAHTLANAMATSIQNGQEIAIQNDSAVKFEKRLINKG